MEQKETKKHADILEAAAELFARQGYRKTTIDEIVLAAGISKGLFYHYYKNKKELYLTLYHTYADLLSLSIRENVDVTDTDFFKRLRQICHMRIEFVIRNPALWRFLYSAYKEKHPEIAPLIREKNEAILQKGYLSSMANIDWSKLRKEVAPAQAIELVTWVAEGFLNKVTENGTNVTKEVYEQFDAYIELLKSGLQAE